MRPFADWGRLHPIRCSAPCAISWMSTRPTSRKNTARPVSALRCSKALAGTPARSAWRFRPISPCCEPDDWTMPIKSSNAPIPSPVFVDGCAATPASPNAGVPSWMNPWPSNTSNALSATMPRAQGRSIAHLRSEKVAVVGAGPAGLTAALELRKRGYGVTFSNPCPNPGDAALGHSGLPLPRQYFDP